VIRRQLSYGLITPARNEADNLPRLAESLVAQTVQPAIWVVVDNGSTDGTEAVVSELRDRHPWIVLREEPADHGATRAEPTVRAFDAGLKTLAGDLPDVIVKLDADVSFEPDYFETLLAAFVDDPALGIASGTCYEVIGGEWRQRHVTRGHVWGASRAYRRECLEDVLPLESGLAWDGIDELRAAVNGWRTQTLVDLPFRHHRPEAAREESRWHAWASIGRTSHYMGYRFGYLVLRSLNHARRDVAAFASIWGFLSSALRRTPRYPDALVRSHLRRKQSLRNLPSRIAEAFGRHA
jgi:glycosyltransferase involved in cell wall biosynthesis